MNPNKNSFNKEFCDHLEYHLCDTFANSNDEKLKGFWCDGIASREISKKNINDNRQIETIAWIGKDGQTKYEMTIFFGQYALRRFARGTSMIDCLPSSESMDWLEIDVDKRWIEIQLQ